MSFNEQGWRTRFRSMGDEAEEMFERIEPLGPRYVEWGWRRPRIRMSSMTEEVRHTPDFLMESGQSVEAIGCGKDGVLKLKLTKREALLFWDHLQPVYVFGWNSARSEWCLMSMDQVESMIEHAPVLAFNDGNEYYPIQWDEIIGRIPYDG